MKTASDGSLELGHLVLLNMSQKCMKLKCLSGFDPRDICRSSSGWIIRTGAQEGKLKMSAFKYEWTHLASG